ncbi:ABC transporter permease [Candidatus Babeliales bacterium]|nr:ABC transporter permease [Candidatus Babeliales bacterium]
MKKKKSVKNLSNKTVESYYQQVGKEFWKSRSAKFGLFVFVVVCIMAFACPLLSPYDPLSLNIRESFAPPSRQHLFGTDSYGRDIFSRILYGARVSMRIGLEVLLVTVLIGAIIGIITGWFKSLDNILMRIMDGFMAFPAIVLALAIRAALGPMEFNLVIALSLTQIPRVARIVRSSVLKTREMGFIRSAKAVGASDWRILILHILPNSLAPLIVQASFIFATVILAEAGLSFVGVGVPPPSPSWGSIVAEGRDYIRTAPWIAISPGIVIIIVVLGLNLLGDGLRDILDPKMQGVLA